MRTHQVRTSDDVTLEVREEGDGRPVVLVSGFTAPSSTWGLQVPALLEAGHRVVLVDRRSHGRSESPGHGQRVARHGMDLHDVVTALRLEDSVLVGASMGASSCWAHCDLLGTAHLAGLVALDQTPRMVSAPDWSHGFYGLRPDNCGTFFDDGIPATGRGLTPEQAAPGVERMLALVDPDERAGVIRPETVPLLRDHALQDWRDVVRRLAVPQLLVAGRESQFWPCEHAAAAVADNPRARAVVIDGCGHAVQVDAPDEVNALLLDFLAGL